MAQGQVIGYAGHTGLNSGNAHLHFFIQPNAVERECLPLDGIDAINYITLSVTSRNLSWEQVTLVDPPQALLDRLPPLLVSQTPSTVAARLSLSPDTSVNVPLQFTGALSSTIIVRGARNTAHNSARPEPSLFWVTIKAQTTVGNYGLWLAPRLRNEKRYLPPFKLLYAVRSTFNTAPATGLLLDQPTYLTPTGYNSVNATPEMCWRVPRSAGQAPFEYRVLVAGPTATDSGWMGATCWTPPPLLAGTYYWKVLVRDAHGYMNRTNQRPYAFIVSQSTD